MKDPRHRDGVELREGEGLVRTTIVGGQPRKRPAIRMTVKVGLERVLYLAATDRDFRTALLVERTAALKAAGLSLSDGESAILDAVGPESLASMIDAVQPRSRPQRPFLRSVAATFLTLATGTASVGCEAPVATGIEPDTDFDRDTRSEMVQDLDVPPADLGIEPDVPDVYPDAGSDPGLPDDAPFLPDTRHDAPAGSLADIPSMDVDVPEVFPDTGITLDVAEDVQPTDILMDADAPVVGGILPDDPGMPADGTGADPQARGGRASSKA